MAEGNLLPPGLIVAAPKSGAGKTTLTLGLLRAFARRGVRVHPFKCGPDYIDPAFHEAAAGVRSYNIDSWAMRWELAGGLLATASESRCDYVIAEGLMGLFDGVMQGGQWGNGASADLAVRTGWPVVLVLDVAGQSQTAAAVASGFANFKDGVDIAGIVLNRVGSERHARLARSAIEASGLKVLGVLPRDSGIVLPERHLGLVQAGETTGLDAALDNLADFIERHIDIAALQMAARRGTARGLSEAKIKPPGQRIALARDAAFSFVYPHLLDGWQRAGAEILPFSPLADEGPRQDADVAWLPGGYPELHGPELARAGQFRAKITEFAKSRPVHGECGGYMVLGRGIVDAQGRRHEMLGLLGLETSFEKRRLHLGYRSARLRQACCLGPVGLELRGHEFHYASVLANPDTPLLEASDSEGNSVAEEGGRREGVSGSFFHFVDAG